MLSDDVRRTVADALRDAEASRAPIPPLRETWPDIDVVDAYEIQLLNIRRRLEAGARRQRPQGRASPRRRCRR